MLCNAVGVKDLRHTVSDNQTWNYRDRKGAAVSRPAYSTRARIDLVKIGKYIARDNQTAAISFIDRVEQKCENLADSPDMGFTCDDLSPGLLSWPIGNYVIFYRTCEDGIEVVHILRGARDPRREFE